MRSNVIMRALFVGAVALILNVAPAFAGGNTNACYSITDHDRRNACLAEAKKDKGTCYSIMDHDKRAMCQAKTSGDKSACYSIQDHNQRNACMAGMGW